MKKLLLTPLGLLAVQHSYGQDSAAAIYINEYIAQIEARLQIDILEKKDTAIYYEDSLKNVPLRVHTEFYTHSETMQVEKIVEKSSYNNLTTEIIVYFRFNQPIRLTSIQKKGNAVKADFDVYYVNNSAVHFTKRIQGTGNPDGDAMLVWCRELLNDYNKMVESQKEAGIIPPEKTGKLRKSFFIFKRKKSG